jgi:hypothetical protein
MAALRLVRLAVIAGLAALPISNAANAQQPVKEGDTLTGKLRRVAARHPNGTGIEAWQIVSRPRMMPANDDFCDYKNGATTFHLLR